MYRVCNTFINGHKLINLKHVSQVHLKDNVIKLTMASERNNLWGNFVAFSGGNTNVVVLYHKTDKEAHDEFIKIEDLCNKS